MERCLNLACEEVEVGVNEVVGVEGMEPRRSHQLRARAWTAVTTIARQAAFVLRSTAVARAGRRVLSDPEAGLAVVDGEAAEQQGGYRVGRLFGDRRGAAARSIAVTERLAWATARSSRGRAPR